MYTALLTDLDGTVVKTGSDGRDIDVQTKLAVQRAQDAGIKISCATGRGWQSAAPVVQQLGLVDPCIIEGGARIINATNGSVLWEKPFSKKISNEILALLKKLQLGNEIIKSTSHPFKVPITQVEEMTDENRIIYVIGVHQQIATSIIEHIASIPDVVAHTTVAWHSDDMFDVHITHAEATKEHAAAVWRDIIGVSKEQVIGMGDGMNDLPLFASVGLRVAVANAPEALKRSADYLAPSREEGALHHVLEKYFLE